jgi:hypothetical protein
MDDRSNSGQEKAEAVKRDDALARGSMMGEIIFECREWFVKP